MEYSILPLARRGAARFALCALCLLLPVFAQAAPVDHGDQVIGKGKLVSIHHGKASYLSKKFQGRKTANGEIFRHEKLTAAHKTLPFGTVLRVTRLSNGRSVIVRVNDRGPFIKGRFVDLSRTAASKLNMLRGGVTEVQIEVIANPKGEPLFPGEAFYVVLARGSDAETAQKEGEAVRRKIPSKHRKLFKNASVFALDRDPRHPRFFLGLGPFACFEDAHKAFLALPAKTGHDVICGIASRED